MVLQSHRGSSASIVTVTGAEGAGDCGAIAIMAAMSASIIQCSNLLRVVAAEWL
jgi:hypothetical protein